MNGREMFRCEVDQGTARITMDRTPVNAINAAWIDGFSAYLDELEGRDDWKVLHIRSNRHVFCAGADLNQLQRRLDEREGERLLMEDTRRFQALFARIESLPRLSLAEIGGAAMGGGFELALACDLRIAALESRIGLPEARLGLLPGAGGTQRLTRLCGRGVAARIILTAEAVDGAEAHRLGLVQWAVPGAELAETAASIAAAIAALPASALAASKRCIAAAGDPAIDGFAREIEETGRMFASAETRERVAAFLSRRQAG